MSKTYTITDRDEPIRLTAAESLQMAQAIVNPRKPNAKLREAVKRYLETVEVNRSLPLPTLSRRPANTMTWQLSRAASRLSIAICGDGRERKAEPRRQLFRRR